MFTGDQLPKLALKRGLIAACLLCSLAVHGEVLGSDQARAHTEDPKRATDQSKPLSVTVVGGVELKESPSTKNSEADRQWREQLDLVAQQKAADAAWVQVWINAAGLLALLATAFYAHKAWEEAAQSNRDARAFFTAERRARIKVTPFIDGRIYDGVFPETAATDYINIKIVRENVGALPAINVSVHIEPTTWRFKSDELASFRQALEARKSFDLPTARTLAPGESEPRTHIVPIGTHAENTIKFTTRFIFGWAEYQLEEGGATHFTPFIWQLIAYRTSNRDGSYSVPNGGEAHGYIFPHELSVPPT